MMLDDSLNLYEVLELSPYASSQEIRAAYLRAKAAYRKDSVALYSLLSGDETEQLLQRIEEAYQTLSHPDKRRDYDRKLGIATLANSSNGISTPAPRPLAPIVSIDRVPPMEASATEEDLLSAPTTDFTLPTANSQTGSSASASASANGTRFLPDPLGTPLQATATDPFPEPQILKKPTAPLATSAPVEAPARDRVPPTPSAAVQLAMTAQAELQGAITQETEWRGAFLRKVREARRVSIEEMADSTKISRSYLVAIEEENFSRLPAPVYLRGFLLQYARYLRIPQEAAASAYLARYHQAKGRAQ